jgi:CarboxypepD_reg-like domain/Putative zinc-finger
MRDHDGDSVSGSVRAGDGGHVDEGTVHAWLDGQLSEDAAAQVSMHIAACAACSAVVAEARGHIAAATRILNALDGVPARVVPRATRRIHRWQLRAAAAIFVVALGTAVVLRGPAGLRSMYEASPVPATHAPEAPAAPQTPPAQLPTAGGAMRAAGPMVRPAPKQKSVPETRVQANSLRHAPTTGALAAKAQRESGVMDQAPPSVSTAGGSTLKPQSPAPAFAPALGAAAPADSVAGRARARVAPPMTSAITVSPEQEQALAAPQQAAIAESDTVVRQITGRVVEADAGAPIPAASVQVGSTPIGQSTTDSGSFNLAVPSTAKSLTVRRIGYVAQTVPLTPGATDYTIPMKKDVLSLEAQVATGVATQSAAIDLKVTAGAESSGGAARAQAAGANASRCRGLVVWVPVSDSTHPDSIAVRLTGVPSMDADHPGLVARPVPDTVGAGFGRWQPLGADSALVGLNNPAGTVPRRVACGNRYP